MKGNHAILHLLQQVRAGALAPEDALLQLKLAPFEDLGYAKIDSHRPIRQGASEVLYGAGKTPEQLVGILTAMIQQGSENILITRMTPEAAELVSARLELEYHPLSRIGIAQPTKQPARREYRPCHRRYQRHSRGGRGRSHRPGPGQSGHLPVRHRRLPASTAPCPRWT